MLGLFPLWHGPRLVLLVLLGLAEATTAARPNIVFILMDDLGWNDVQYHGSPQIPTPHIDELAAQGVILEGYHAQPVCSPTRASIMSGRHVIHTGVYMPFAQGTALRLNLTYTLLPEYLKTLNYTTHMVGKWHLGQNTLTALPTGRGFESYLGYWSGAEDYYTHTTKGGYDFQYGTATAFEYNGTYSTPIFAARAVQVIEDAAASPSSDPLFLYLAFQNVHWPLEAPQAYLNKFPHITDSGRKHVAAMASIADDAIANVTAALKRTGLYDNTLIVFASDNGGPTHGDEGTQSNNYPLRGGKNTIFEGGTRVLAFVHGPKVLQKSGYIQEGLMHATDWLPTLVTLANDGKDWRTVIPKDEPVYVEGDGMNVWPMLRDGTASPRTWVLHEAHPNDGDEVHGNALIMGNWKIIKTGQVDPRVEDGWYPPPGQNPAVTPYTVHCGTPPPNPPKETCKTHFCLFDLSTDPCEHNDVSGAHPDVVQTLHDKLKVFQSTAVPPVKPEGCQPKIDAHGAWRPCA